MKLADLPVRVISRLGVDNTKREAQPMTTERRRAYYRSYMERNGDRARMLKRRRELRAKIEFAERLPQPNLERLERWKKQLAGMQ